MVMVRRADPDDAALLSALNADVQALHAAAFPERFKPPGPDTFPPAAAQALLANSNNVVFIAEAAGQPAGYLYAEVARRPETAHTFRHESVHVHHISVRPEFRRQGVGTALIAAIRAACHEIGISLITLDVWTFNADARAFFKREGFSPYNERLWSR